MTTHATFIKKLQQHAQASPNTLALSSGKSIALSYQNLLAQTEILSAAIKESAESVDFIVILTHRNHFQVLGILAGLTIQCPTAVIDLRQGSERLLDLLQQGHHLLCIADEVGEKILAPLRAAKKLDFIEHYFLLSENQDHMLNIHHKACTSLSARSEPLGKLPDSTAIILFTSGSTGSPKGVCISSSDLDQRLVTEEQWFELESTDCVLGVLPLNFDVGITQLLGTFYAGGHHFLANSWLPADIITHVEAYPITGLAMSPMVWRQLLKAKDQDKLWQRLNQLRYVTLSGGTLETSILKSIITQLNHVTLIKTYGQTEMFRIASLKISPANVDKHALATSVGQAYLGVSLHIHNENGEPVKNNEIGEIIANGLGQMSGYVPRHGENKTEKNDFIATGDYGYIDDTGNLFIHGRKNEMVKIFDQRIFPDDIANSLQTILDISPIIVIPSEDVEPKLIAFFEEHNNSKTDLELKSALRGKIASHLIPSQFFRLTAIPSTTNGKIDKVALKKLLHPDT